MSRPVKLADFAPRLARARDGIRRDAMRGIHRCSCGSGWRITGHEYDYGTCFERVEHAQAVRDKLPEFAEPSGLEGEA